jgi:hypothetical protein
VIGFGLTRLLNFDLLPRIKRINHLRLYLPGWEDRQAYPNLAPALVQRAIDWDLIGQHCSLVKWTVGLDRVGFHRMEGGEPSAGASKARSGTKTACHACLEVR